MGISGLLPLLKSIQKPTQLAKFKGQTIGVDAYVWLHRGATACAIPLALGQPTTKYVDFAMSRVRMLQHFGVIPYIVFDGDSLPSKAGTNQDRHARRKEAKKLGTELLQLGKTAQAHQELQKAVEITHEMANMFVQELRKANVKYVVAPYEADAQLAYLEREGHIQAVVSEDSDLLVFGVKTLLTKLDQYGECVMVRREEFGACREVSLVFWTDEQFRQMAILSGCDYLDNIANLGLKTAHRLLRKHKTVERVLQALRLEGKLKVPESYLDDFKRAELTFLYQWVFCPKKQGLVNLTTPQRSIDFERMPFIGAKVDDLTAAGVADGSLHPRTKQTMVLSRAIGSAVPHSSRSTSIEQENLNSKKNMTIGEFFKKRQPLADLDPNSFIMTPRQSDLARRASSRTWSSTPVSAATNATVPASIPQGQRAPVVGHSQRRLSSATTPENVKRQRLCFDDVLLPESDIKTAMSESSPFFQPAASSKCKAKKKRTSVGFSIFSDDSIDDALNAIPEPVNALVPDTTTTDERASLPAEEEDSQDTLVAIETSALDFIEDVEQTFVDEAEGSHGIPSKPSLLYNKFSMTPASATLETCNFNMPDHTTIESGKIELVAKVNKINRPVHPPATKNIRAATLTASCVLAQAGKVSGSEDLIASESESEDQEDRRGARALDIQRFTFPASS